MKTNVETELAGFVKNKTTGKYELLFSSFIGSPLLVRNRAVEKASDINKFSRSEKYDVADVKVMQRQSITIATQWSDFLEEPSSAKSELVPVYAVVEVTSMSDYTEPHCYSTAPDHEEIVSLWFCEEKAQKDAQERSDADKKVVATTDYDPTYYKVRQYFVQ